MECKYHKTLEKLHEAVWMRIDNYYDWEFFGFWLGLVYVSILCLNINRDECSSY